MKALAQWLRQALDRLALYLPLLVMALLALGSWSLVRQLPGLPQTASSHAVREDPDYSLGRFSVKVMNASGRLQQLITGDAARHFPHTDELHIDEVRVQAVGDSDAHFHVRARQGMATGDNQLITLVGNAVAVRQADAKAPQTELRGSKFLVKSREDRLLSSEPVEILRGQDRFTALTLDFNSRTGEYALQGQVRATLAPRHER